MWYSHTKEYYSALNRKEILTHATTWMNLEEIMQSEKSQSQKKTNSVGFHIYKVARVVNPQRQNVEWWLPGVGEGTMGDAISWVQSSVL